MKKQVVRIGVRGGKIVKDAGFGGKAQYAGNDSAAGPKVKWETSPGRTDRKTAHVRHLGEHYVLTARKKHAHEHDYGPDAEVYGFTVHRKGRDNAMQHEIIKQGMGHATLDDAARDAEDRLRHHLSGK